MADAAKTLIVGAHGQVGTQLLRLLRARKRDDDLIAPRRGDPFGEGTWDLACLPSLEAIKRGIGDERLEAIYCVAGMTHVDGCEAQQELAFRTNATGPGLLARYAEMHDVPFVYFSTEYVFDGASEHPGPYDERSAVNPINVYGRSKLEGEQRALDACGKALVVRTTVVYGADAQEKNFLYAVLRNLGEGRRMRVPEDQVSTPTYNKDLAAATLALRESEEWGIWHVAGPELMNRFHFAQRIAGLFGLDRSLLDAVPTFELQQAARRPLFAGLAIGKLQQEHPEISARGMTEAFPEYHAEVLNHSLAPPA